MDVKDLVSLLDKHAAELQEHFDTVQIFCTREVHNETKDTESFSSGKGNYFARYGQVVEWLYTKKIERLLKEDEN